MADARPTTKAPGNEDQYRLLANVLRVAADTEEPDARSGNSSRLLRIGSELAARQAEGSKPEDPVDLAYDIAALVSASRRVPGDKNPSAGRVDLVAQAGRILKSLAGHERGDILSEDVAPPRAVPSGSMPRAGHTSAQLVVVLEVVAGRLAALNRLLMVALEEVPRDSDALVMLDAAQAMVLGVGALADSASGGSIVGGHDAWNFGPHFAEAGKAGAA